MMSDKFMQQFLTDSSDKLLQVSNHKLAPIPLVNRSGATTEAIKAYIMQHRLVPGSPLPTEAELCAELGVSRSSVREALRKLEALDIVTVRQGRGACVADVSLRPLVETLILRASISPGDNTQSLRDVVALRKYLDLGMSADVVESFQGREHPDLHEAIDQMIVKAEAGERFLEEDSAFHAGILDAVGNEVAQQMVSALWLVHMVVVPSLADSNEGLMRTAHAHREILTAAESGDIKGYRAAVRKHYKPLEKILKKQRKAEASEDEAAEDSTAVPENGTEPESKGGAKPESS